MILNGNKNVLHIAIILNDLLKAFDILDQKVLLENEMHTFFIQINKMVSLLSHTHRWFFVSLHNVFLEGGTINWGVPQGSISRPLLFLLYINDIPQTLSCGHTYLCTDDKSILYQHKNITEIEDVLNKKICECKRLVCW